MKPHNPMMHIIPFLKPRHTKTDSLALPKYTHLKGSPVGACYESKKLGDRMESKWLMVFVSSQQISWGITNIRAPISNVKYWNSQNIVGPIPDYIWMFLYCTDPLFFFNITILLWKIIIDYSLEVLTCICRHHLYQLDHLKGEYLSKWLILVDNESIQTCKNEIIPILHKLFQRIEKGSILPNTLGRQKNLNSIAWQQYFKKEKLQINRFHLKRYKT